MNTQRIVILCTVIVVSFCSLGAACSEPKPLELERVGIEAMSQGDYEQAETVFRELIAMRPDSFVGYYNLAAALSMAGDANGAVNELSAAITLGFTDLRQIKRDPDLENLRETTFYSQLVSSWPDLIQARRESDVASMKGLIRRGLETRTDEHIKFELLSAHDQIATDQALDELGVLADWANGTLFTDTGSLVDQPWITVVLPDRAGFGKWAIKVFGPGVRGNISSVGGAYEHQKRRLVAQDLGATLRHEFIHVLHWRDMNRLGQVHAPWIQEGLASLVEDYDQVSNKVVPVVSWRTNIVKRMHQAHRLPKIAELASTQMQSFTSNRPLAKYAQARGVMLYLLDQHQLTEFYANYVSQYNQDSTGILSLETTLKREITEIENDYREWIDGLDMVAETGADLSATLGIDIETGTGDGVVVKKLPGNARTRTGLRMGSVITAIDGRPTRDLLEFIRVLGQYSPGQTITIDHRRGSIHSKSDVVLLKK